MTVSKVVFPQQVLSNCSHTVPYLMDKIRVFYSGLPVRGFNKLTLDNTIISYSHNIVPIKSRGTWYNRDKYRMESVGWMKNILG